MVQFPSARNLFDLNLLPDSEEQESDSHDESEFPEQESESISRLDKQTRPFAKAIGFKFNPTDVELVLGYLQPFSEGKSLPKNKIHVKDIYLYHPDQLLVEFEKANEKDLFFFTPRSRVGRTAVGGVWHSTTGSKDITLGNNTVIGHRQCFKFFDRKLVNTPSQGKTNWLMIEYRLVDFTKSSSVKVPTVDLDRRLSETSSVREMKDPTVDLDRRLSETSSVMEMKDPTVDLDRRLSETSSLKENSSVCKTHNVVLSKVYYKHEENNNTDEYAEFIKMQQQLVIEDEKTWEDMQSRDKEHFPKRTRS